MHEAHILPVDALTHKGKENTSCESRWVLATHSRKVTVTSQWDSLIATVSAQWQSSRDPVFA